MTQFKAKVEVCLKDSDVNFTIELNIPVDVDINCKEYITFLDSKNQRHLVLFIETMDGSRIGVGGNIKKTINSTFVNKDLKEGMDVDIALYNDNALFNPKNNSVNFEEPRESGNGGVVGVISCSN